MMGFQRGFTAIVLSTLALAAAAGLARGEDMTNAAPAEMRAWHSVSGTSVEAAFVKLQYGDLHLRNADGQTLVIGLGGLVPDDQAVAKELASLQDAASRKPSKPQVSKELIDLFGEELFNAKRKKLGASELAGAEKIGIYFSAYWCPPCRAFTPKLVDAYNELRKGGKPFEVVFVSADRGEDDMFGYMRGLNMPWLAVPYTSAPRAELAKKYQVSGIPRLVIIDSTGKVLSNSADRAVRGAGAAAYDGW